MQATIDFDGTKTPEAELGFAMSCSSETSPRFKAYRWATIEHNTQRIFHLMK